MNEGCATFVHYTILNQLYDKGLLTEGSMLDEVTRRSILEALSRSDAEVRVARGSEFLDAGVATGLLWRTGTGFGDLQRSQSDFL